MAGRRPTPTATKILQGNPGKRKINHREPQPGGIPKCPSHLNATAKREWRRISAELISLGLLTEVDRAALASYCAAYSTFVDAELNLAKFGLVIKSPKSGMPIANPFLGVRNRALDLIRQFSIEFGLTPAARTRLSVDPATQAADPFEEFMSSIGGDEITDAIQPEPEPACES
jgi:P27 family predicted phage terminase small subunit